MPKLKPGDQAPDVTLLSVDNEEVRLSDLWEQDLTALVFYRGDFCPACNRYLHSLQERSDEFRSAGLQVVAVSADQPSVEQKTVQAHGLNFAVLSDSTHAAIEAYDVVYNEQAGYAQPAVFIIDTSGRVLYEAITSGPIGRPSPDDLLMIARGIKQNQVAAKA